MFFYSTPRPKRSRNERGRAGNGNGAMRGGAPLLCVEVAAVLKTFGVAAFHGIGDVTLDSFACCELQPAGDHTCLVQNISNAKKHFWLEIYI